MDASYSIDPEKPILVTGASGFIASWIVKYLLEDGYTVHGTVRDRSAIVKVAHLEDMANKAHGKLILFEADLLTQGSFAEAMKDCELVIHTASPFQTKVKNPQLDLINPALEGTRNVLQTVNEQEQVKKVVLTSSVAAVFGDAREIEDTEHGIFTEDHWNLSSEVKHQPYSYSKTLAEKEAWRMSQDQIRWRLVGLNPAFVLGPSLSRRVDSVSTSFMLNMVKGTNRMGLPDLSFGIVDVRDVAQAHIRAGMIDTACGRHILAAETLPLMEVAKILRNFFGNKYPIPTRKLPEWITFLFGPLQGFSWKYLDRNLDYFYELNNNYSIQNLGMTYRPVEETLIDQVKDFEEKGMI